MIAVLSLVFSIFLFGLIMIKSPSGFKKFGNKTILLSILLVALMVFLYAWHRISVYTNSASYFNTTWNYPVPNHLNKKYGIMFDAGSTGSRIHIFKFQSYVSNDSLILEDSYFKSIKPGLSSYAKSPKLAAESLEPLLQHAKKYVPKHLWSSTPLALKATAGLRLLPQKASDDILAEVKKLFGSYPFDLSVDGVSIMKGDDEGLFSWFTVNFLNDKFSELSKTVGVLDLGGGSTQITFIPKTTELLQYKSHPHIVHRKLFGDQITIYTHSYLGLGMMSARFQILGGTEQVTGNIPPQNLESFCLPFNWNGTWEYRGGVHKLKSSYKNETKSRWQLCNKEVKNLINKYKIDKSFSIQDSEFYAISYFYDQLEFLNVTKDQNGGFVVSINTYVHFAQKVCRVVSISNPFQCLDLCYISSLLTEGYNFSLHKPLTVRKKIRSYEIAWPLGAMFDVYNRFSAVDQSPPPPDSPRTSVPEHLRHVSARQTTVISMPHSS